LKLTKKGKIYVIFLLTSKITPFKPMLKVICGFFWDGAEGGVGEGGFWAPDMMSPLRVMGYQAKGDEKQQVEGEGS
jgi:hypothetical protein